MESIGFTFKKKIIANFHVLGFLYLKNEFRAKKKSVCHTARRCRRCSTISGKKLKIVVKISLPFYKKTLYETFSWN
jgi:hypothetical protein